MHPSFSFKLLREDLPTRRLQARAMHVMSALFIFIYALHYWMETPEQWMYLMLLAPAPLLIIALVIFRKRIFDNIHNNRVFRLLEIALLLSACLHFLQIASLLAASLYLFVALIIAFLWYIEHRIFQDEYVLINSEFLGIPGALSDKKYAWDALEKVTIKNHYLTLFFRDQLQRQVRIYPSTSREEQEACLSFCEQMILERNMS